MKLIIVATLAALTSVAYSQAGLPTCAQACVNKFTSGSEIGSCGNLDIKCICSSSSFLSSIACCLAAACDAADQQAAVTYAKQICTTAGVTVPDAVSCVSSSAVAPATSSASSAVAPSSSSVSTSSAASLAPPPSAASTSGSPAPSTTASVSPSASATKNAAIQNAAGAGMSFVGGLAAVMALV